MKVYIFWFSTILFVLACQKDNTNKLSVNESSTQPGEWGFHPKNKDLVQETPPGFVWRPQEGAKSYDLQCTTDPEFSEIVYEAINIEYNIHRPSKAIPAGRWFWRFRYRDNKGTKSKWSTTREFIIDKDALITPLPERHELINRIPTSHPRLFVRPEQLPEFRKYAQTDLKAFFTRLEKTCETLLKHPPSTDPPPLYSADIIRKSEAWKKIWWSNRERTIEALNGAATLAFTWSLGGKKEYGLLAKQILLACADWDPKGATSYLYNDEAAMPYAYHFSRAYTFIYGLLSETEKEKCRAVMKARATEIYQHLYPGHLWRPFGSHENRAWHFLGEVGIAFLHEIPDAADWVWFAANVYSCLYPVWGDKDGGWHEGLAYWRSYMRRFMWWGDIMHAAFGINAFSKRYFLQTGYYPMYLQPPGTKGGGFGDLNAELVSEGNQKMMADLAVQLQNPYWQWYVEAHGGTPRREGYIDFIRDFIRGTNSVVISRSPKDLPTSRCFWGIGQAILNTNLEHASNNVELIFKSSPFGAQSHGYEPQNAFLLYAFGERLFIRSGRRDIHKSDHHRNWMWQTKSTNCITVNGHGQIPRSNKLVGEIIEFQTSPIFDYVAGEAALPYSGMLETFTRRILFVKPEVLIIFDTLSALKPSSFEWHLHAPTKMDILDTYNVHVKNGKASCNVTFLWPKEIELVQTDQFDPPPRNKQLVEYHLTAKTLSLCRKQNFITVLQPYPFGKPSPGRAKLYQTGRGFEIFIPLTDGQAKVSFLVPSGKGLNSLGMEGEVSARILNGIGLVKERFTSKRTLVQVQ